ncbi:Asp23/Gls24 family envelope stress response protein [Curtobacterium oceanosedimentum]|uniref:Asp23/Gls24 family envelope stress response protein n=1 Tax=Curtobacterium oceanosedimentum TaxID=465820 RepID=UPI001CE10817|nr:Asp23/Gls24 family envelope stress response protein [Curtobacterium oceanosedimentum]MCA5922683.1 Asp23/Gls24 family envelope stress response protein [Curtobacterium oceanosedimentum]
MQHDPHAQTPVTEVPLPAELTAPLPDDANTATVVARTAAETALAVPGVHHLGGIASRAADQLRRQLGRSAGTAGVQVDDEDGTFAVHVSVIVTYPRNVREVADEVRRQVTAAAGQVTTAPTTVDVRVLDVHGPFDDEPAPVERAATAAGDAVQDAAEATVDATRQAADATAEATKRAADATADVTKQAAEATADATGRAADATADTARRAADATADTTKRAADATADAARRAADATADTAGRAHDAASDALDRASEGALDAADTARDAAGRARAAVADEDRTGSTAADVAATETAADAAVRAADSAEDAAQDAADAAADASAAARAAAHDADRPSTPTTDRP